MCGIVGYIGHREAWPIVIKGLKRLEYRGYDSAGIALINDTGLNIFKKAGKVKGLEDSSEGKNLLGSIGIGHTRWATHGAPSDRNDLRYAIDPSKLQEKLDWVPSLQFEDGLAKTVDWYLENEVWLSDVTSGNYQTYYDNQYADR